MPTIYSEGYSAIWEMWGKVSRWQLSGVPMLGLASILEQTVKSLHEANEHPSTDASEQYTILDGLKLLSDDKFRSRGD